VSKYFISCLNKYSTDVAKFLAVQHASKGKSELSHALITRLNMKVSLEMVFGLMSKVSEQLCITKCPKKSYTLNIEAPLGMLFGMLLLLLFKEQAALTESSQAVSNWVRLCWGGSRRSLELKASSTRVRKGVAR